MPKFSIIIPVYNVEQYLPKCLDSLVNQTYSNIEIICVNDGSPDNSQAILEEYKRKHYDLKPSTEITENDDILILPQEYFYPVPVGLKIKPEQKEIFVTENSYTVHWNDGNWSSSEVYNSRDYFSKNKHKIELNKLLKICFDNKKVILDNLFLQITKSCGLYNVSIYLYWLFRFKYRYDLKSRRWLVLFIAGIPFKLFQKGG